jgi:tetratricopeptide (TPR) repeat protein
MYLNSEELDKAVADFNEANRLDPTNIWALADRGLAFAWKRKFEEARRDLDAAAKIDPENVVVLRGRAFVAELNDDFETAAGFYRRSLVKEPDNTFARAHLASALLQLGRNEEALAGFSGILAKDPDNMTALAARAGIYRSLGDFDKAMADLDRALVGGQPPPAIRLLRANVLRGQGKSELVMKEADLLMKENPNSEFALVAAAKILSAEGQRDKAMAALDKALAIHRYAYIYMNREQVRQRSDYAGRMADLDEALKLEPDQSEALAMKASLLVEQKRFAEALAAYDSALAQEPSSLRFQRGRAAALYKTGRVQEAEKAFAAIRTKSTQAADLNSLCWEKATAGIMIESALADCIEATKLAPTNSSYQDSLAFALLRLGKLDESITAYTSAIAKGKSAASYMGRALAYLRKGDIARARADRGEALKRNRAVEVEFADYGLPFATDQNSRVSK